MDGNHHTHADACSVTIGPGNRFGITYLDDRRVRVAFFDSDGKAIATFDAFGDGDRSGAHVYLTAHIYAKTNP